MFWKVTGLAQTSPVEVLLDKGDVKLEELLDEDELIQECKSLNGRLVAYLQEREQVKAMVRYVVAEPPADADERRKYKYPFISCEVFTCEIDSLLNTLLENDELMDLLFSFVEPDRNHEPLLSGYFCKVVICLLVRRTHEVMLYLQRQRHILQKLVELIGITSIMEVLTRLVGGDEQIRMYHLESLTWLAETDLLDNIVEKLDPKYDSNVHSNAAETLCTVAQTTPSPLAEQLASSRFVSKLFNNVLADIHTKSSLIHSLSVCITLLDPKHLSSVAADRAMRLQAPQHAVVTEVAAPETVVGMLARLGDLLNLLDVRDDAVVMPTSYGQLKPPLGIHRLKIVEFVAVLLRSGSQPAREELLRLRAISTILNLFFDFPFNNLLHHQVEAMVSTILESSSDDLITSLFNDCHLVPRILAVDQDPIVSTTYAQCRPGKAPHRTGNLGHLTRIANRLVELAPTNTTVAAALDAEPDFRMWKEGRLRQKNATEDVWQWSCGRPTQRERTSTDISDGEDELVDDDEFRSQRVELDLSVASNSLSKEPFQHRYALFEDEQPFSMVETSDPTSRVVIPGLSIMDDQDSSDEEDDNDSALGGSLHLGFPDSDSDDEDTGDSAPRGNGREDGGGASSNNHSASTADTGSPTSPARSANTTTSSGPGGGGGGASDDDEVVVGSDELGSPTGATARDLSEDLSAVAAAAAAGASGSPSPSCSAHGGPAGATVDGAEPDLFGEGSFVTVRGAQSFDAFGDASPFRASTSLSHVLDVFATLPPDFSEQVPSLPPPSDGQDAAAPGTPPQIETFGGNPADSFGVLPSGTTLPLAVLPPGSTGPTAGPNLFADEPEFFAFPTATEEGRSMEIATAPPSMPPVDLFAGASTSPGASFFEDAPFTAWAAGDGRSWSTSPPQESGPAAACETPVEPPGVLESRSAEARETHSVEGQASRPADALEGGDAGTPNSIVSSAVGNCPGAAGGTSVNEDPTGVARSGGENPAGVPYSASENLAGAPSSATARGATSKNGVTVTDESGDGGEEPARAARDKAGPGEDDPTFNDVNFWRSTYQPV